MGDWEFCHERTGESFPGTRRAASWLESRAVARRLSGEAKRCMESGSLFEEEGRARET